MNITQKIEKLREKKGWSVARLARETNIPTVSLRVMLKRKEGNNWNTVPLQRIADVLGVSVSYLTSDDEEYYSKPKLTYNQYLQLQEQIDELIQQFFDIENNM